MTRRQLTIAALLAFGTAGSLSAHLQLTSTPSHALVSSTEPGAVTAAPTRQDATNQQLLASYATGPLHFEANQGQTDSEVKFLARGSGYTLFLTSTEAVLVTANRATESNLASHGRADFERVDGEPAGRRFHRPCTRARPGPNPRRGN